MTLAEPCLRIDDPPPVADAGLRALYAYWCELGAAAGGLPGVQAFDALHLPRLLPSIWLLEVDSATGRFRMRLAGESINIVYGRNLGGKYLADLFDPAELPTVVDRYRRALGEPAIIHATGNVYAAAGQYSMGERLGLPMLGRDGGTSIVLGGTVYDRRAPDHAALRTIGDTPTFHTIHAANHRAVEIVGG